MDDVQVCHSFILGFQPFLCEELILSGLAAGMNMKDVLCINIICVESGIGWQNFSKFNGFSIIIGLCGIPIACLHLMQF